MGRRRQRRFEIAAVSAVVGLGVVPAAGAADWTIRPTIEVAETYNSNVTLAPKGAEIEDYITQVRPGLSVRGKGSRLELNADYNPELLFYADESDRNRVLQQGGGRGRAELLEQHLFLDASAAVDQSDVGFNTPTDQNRIADNGRLVTVQVFDVSPSYRHHLGSIANAELRYRHNIVNVDSAQVGDTSSNEGSFTLTSGRYFDSISWKALARTRVTDRDAAQAQTSGSTIRNSLGKIDLQYALNNTLSLLVGGGYEKFSDPTLREQPEGPIWEGGFLYRPQSTTSIRATYGRRFEHGNAAVEAEFGLSPRTTFLVNYAQTITTSQGILADSLSRLEVDNNSQIVDSNTGLPFRSRDPAQGLVDGGFRQKQLSATLRAIRGRNTFVVTALRDQRIFNTVTGDTTSHALTASWSRSISRLISMQLSLSLRDNDARGVNNDNSSYTARGTFSYRLGETLVASLSVERSEVNGNLPANDVKENLVTLRLRKEF
jgi:uncharacterized protein (PEP-CTERM system associated)